MHVRSQVVRWGLLLALALGLVLMHHIPRPHDSTSPPAHAVSAASITEVAGEACDRHPSTDHSGAPLSSPGHGALHLCLAILIGFAVVWLLALRLSPCTTAPGLKHGLAPPGEDEHPPIPVSRRLAVLCVMRC